MLDILIELFHRVVFQTVTKIIYVFLKCKRKCFVVFVPPLNMNGV